MRYTTPEWLLENLEKRLRLALQEQSPALEQHHGSGSASFEAATPSASPSTAVLQPSA